MICLGGLWTIESSPTCAMCQEKCIQGFVEWMRVRVSKQGRDGIRCQRKKAARMSMKSFSGRARLDEKGEMAFRSRKWIKMKQPSNKRPNKTTIRVLFNKQAIFKLTMFSSKVLLLSGKCLFLHNCALLSHIGRVFFLKEGDGCASSHGVQCPVNSSVC